MESLAAPPSWAVEAQGTLLARGLCSRIVPQTHPPLSNDTVVSTGSFDKILHERTAWWEDVGSRVGSFVHLLVMHLVYRRARDPISSNSLRNSVQANSQLSL